MRLSRNQGHLVYQMIYPEGWVEPDQKCHPDNEPLIGDLGENMALPDCRHRKQGKQNMANRLKK